MCIYIYILHLRCRRAFETPPKTNQGPSQRWDPPTIHVRDLPQMSETDLRRYEGQLILWESIPGFRGNSYFVDFGVKTYVSIYQEPASVLQVLDILYQYHRCCLILEWQIHSPVWKISYPLNTGFLPSTEQASESSSLHNPTNLQKVRKKKTKTPNESTRNIHPEPSFRTTSLRVPASPLSTTRPLCLVLRQSRHCQSRSAGGSGATWRLYPWGERIHSTFPNKISPTKNSCFMLYPINWWLWYFKKLLLLQSQRDKDTNKSSLFSNPFHPFPKDKNPPNRVTLEPSQHQRLQIAKKDVCALWSTPHFWHNIRICFVVKSCLLFFGVCPLWCIGRKSSGTIKHQHHLLNDKSSDPHWFIVFEWVTCPQQKDTTSVRQHDEISWKQCHCLWGPFTYRSQQPKDLRCKFQVIETKK